MAALQQRAVIQYIQLSLLLATGTSLLLALTRDDLSKHYHTVAIHEGHSRQTLAILEGVAHQRLLRLEAALSHLVRLERMGIVHLLASCLLAHLPLQFRNTASRPSTSHEADWRIADLDLVGNVKHLNLCIELAGLPEGGVFLVHHHISGSWHVVLVQALDVQSNIVAWICEVHALMVHLNSEHLAGARIG